jgi:pyruvate dehydrogenase E2 component (dihydrolipoamide acetyltransferase)
MGHVVVMPKLGLTMTEGLLAAWLVETGQVVERDEPLLEVETDKITSVVGAPVAGTLLRRVDAGQDVPVGAPIAVIGAGGEDASAVELFDGDEAS